MATVIENVLGEMEVYEETASQIVDCSPNRLDLIWDEVIEFGDFKGYTVWTEKRVYFPISFEGHTWVESVSRDPDGGPTSHICY